MWKVQDRSGAESSWLGQVFGLAGRGAERSGPYTIGGAVRDVIGWELNGRERHEAAAMDGPVSERRTWERQHLDGIVLKRNGLEWQLKDTIG